MLTKLDLFCNLNSTLFEIDQIVQQYIRRGLRSTGFVMRNVLGTLSNEVSDIFLIQMGFLSNQFEFCVIDFVFFHIFVQELTWLDTQNLTAFCAFVNTI